jgi:uncharacterized membrane protein YagU involved in acid resistance
MPFWECSTAEEMIRSKIHWEKWLTSAFINWKRASGTEIAKDFANSLGYCISQWINLHQKRHSLVAKVLFLPSPQPISSTFCIISQVAFQDKVWQYMYQYLPIILLFQCILMFLIGLIEANSPLWSIPFFDLWNSRCHNYRYFL